ncbi:hypothetical protein PR048_015309 [Dryococelus australis]|uniref:Uncharacterized protein n=1 Tax=Dryococelus australis TaxID=614101 RepID=A0ABQ9HGV7_9NEOP|nr:hypothetical protein PR048_015309 [Dryococelus australis]
MLHMMERRIEQKQAVILIDTEHPLPIQFIANQWDFMQNVLSLLKIFDTATFTVSKREYPVFTHFQEENKERTLYSQVILQSSLSTSNKGLTAKNG